ncbi:MAG: MFS transporter [Leptolyngbya sp.]|nr:MFS transporter [Leptolyngbya sp.]
MNRYLTVIWRRFLDWLPALHPQVWWLAAGRLLSQVGIGFTLFYAPIFFVNQVGLSATEVGVGLGLGSVTGIAGRILGGSMVDSPQWGRRPVLLSSSLISAVADGVLVLAQGFPVFLLGNGLMGFGVGLYWPATETVAADLTPPEQRNEAYALVRLADNLGLGSGVVLGGLLISLTGQYRALFVVDGITFLLFFALIYTLILETRPPGPSPASFFQGWGHALRDGNLMLFFLVNVLLTGYLAQVQSALPVYLNRFVGVATESPAPEGLSTATLGLLFTGHVALATLCQLPLARWLRWLPPAQGLMLSALAWGVGFGVVWLAGLGTAPALWASVALALMALAMVIHAPIGATLVAALAPDALRGVYLSVNSMGWAFGYLIGPPLGGWAIDQGLPTAHTYWLWLSASIGLALGTLAILDRRCRSTPGS